ncbi:DUF3088 family protein [Permianibacter aggregans]|uniref:DUF3088 family protein n=1 Tax=Permianibacter aggregans TaxID=1510150 RepID=UPI0012FCDE98|nr:DUF3088 family protein [Permianibacter aggregans]
MRTIKSLERETLFLLSPNFADTKVGPIPFFCIHCAAVEGMLSYFPELQQLLEVKRIAFPRPRPEVIAVLGEAHQSCPVLAVAKPHPGAQHLLKQSTETGNYFVAGPEAIAAYLAIVYGIAAAHPKMP